MSRLGRVLTVALAAGAMALPAAATAAYVPFPDTPANKIAVNNVVRAVVMGDGVAYVGGDFTSATGANGTFARSRVAAFDLDTGDVLPFRADANGVVRALALSGGSLFVGGDFATIGGASRTRLAEVDATSGAVQTAFRVNANGAVRGLAVANGRLYAGGNFGSLGGFAQPRLGAVNLVTRTVDVAFNPVVNGTVAAITTTPDGSRVFAGGVFTTIDGQARGFVAGLDPSGELAGPAFDNTGDYNVQALDTNETGTRLFAAIGGSGNQAAAFNVSNGAKLWRQRADGDVQAVTYSGGNVYFGFHEGFGGDTNVRVLAADAVTGQLETAFRPPVNSFWGVRSLDSSARGLLVGGEFTTINGVEVGRAAFFDVNGAPPPPTNTDLVNPGASWRYNDSGTLQAGWSGSSFDDSAWASGSAQLGYGEGDEATVVGYGPNVNSKYRTTYFRRSFTWDGAHPVTSLNAQVLADDGAVVYLNGKEVVRDNMPAGTIGNTTLAASNRSGSAENVFRSFTLNPADLAVGTNVITVEVHQDASSSSDLSFDFALRATG